MLSLSKNRVQITTCRENFTFAFLDFFNITLKKEKS